MESWDEIRMGLDLLLRTFAVGVMGVAGYGVTLLLPVARQWLAEKITTSAVNRLEVSVKAKAAQILDPASPTISAITAAKEIAASKPQAMQNSGSTMPGLVNAIQEEVARQKAGVA